MKNYSEIEFLYFANLPRIINKSCQLDFFIITINVRKKLDLLAKQIVYEKTTVRKMLKMLLQERVTIYGMRYNVGPKFLEPHVLHTLLIQSVEVCHRY